MADAIMKRIACVGEFATQHRVGVDLRCDPRDRRVIVARDMGDTLRRLQGLRGEEILWVDMYASNEQSEFMRVRGFKAATIEEARAYLWKKAELVEFDRLVEGTSSPDQVARISSRLSLRTFLAEKGKPKCDAMYAYLGKFTPDGEPR